MAARARHLEGAFHDFLTLDFREVEVEMVHLAAKHLARVDHGGLKVVGVVEEADYLKDVVGAIDVEVVDHGGLHHVGLWHDDAVESVFAGLYCHREHAFDGLQRAVKAQFAH